MSYLIVNELETKTSERKAYQFPPVCIWMCFHKVVDVSIYHPVRHHHELGFCHRHSYQWQDIRMLEGFPREDLLAEPLHGILSVALQAGGKRVRPETRPDYLP